MHLSVSRISKSYNPVTILHEVSFVVSDSEQVGLVGANGSGKSTLLRILAGELDADSGQVSLPDGFTVGYLPQDPPAPEGATIDDLIFSAAGGLKEIEARLRELELEMADAGPEQFETLSVEYGDLLERFERAGGYDIEHRIDQVRDGLAITRLSRQQLFATLSGGEQSRVLLASLLLSSPDVLLLDEPTNHLDFASIAWLERYLAAHQGMLIVVSHDRRFLNQTVNRIIAIDEHSHTARDYPGDYDAFAATRERERALWEERFATQQDEIKELRRSIKQLQAGVDRKAPPARDPDKHIVEAGKAQADRTAGKGIRSLEERLRRIEADPVPKPPGMMRLHALLDGDDLQSDEVIRLDDVTVTFDGQTILDAVSATIRRGERVVLVGANGAGKSTLLNVIAGRLQPDSGTVHVAPAARIGYLDQHAAGIDPKQSVFDAYRNGLTGLEHELISDLFRFGLFNVDDLQTPVGQLSSGQRRKLQIARLVADNANLLLLDEPTNHLSLDVLEDFERALSLCSGVMLVASHDRYFIERFGGVLWELAGGRLQQHHGLAGDVLHAMLRSTEIAQP